MTKWIISFLDPIDFWLFTMLNGFDRHVFLRLRRHIYNNGSQELLDAWKSKEVRFWAAPKLVKPDCIHVMYRFNVNPFLYLSST